jgi:hypothetical protein
MAYSVDFADLENEISIEDVIAILGIDMKRVGPDRLVGRCPLHDGTDPRQFVVTPSKSLWHCFGKCDEGGRHLKLAARMWNCDIKDAAKELKKRLSNGQKHPVAAPKDFSKVKDDLVADHASLQPLGLDPEACRHFECGWRGKGFGTGRLLLPVHDIAGNALLGYVARSVKKDQDPLFMWPKDLSGDGLLFNAHRVKTGELFLFSDPIKVILAYQHNFQAVASYGPASKKTLDALSKLLEEKKIEKVEIL